MNEAEPAPAPEAPTGGPAAPPARPRRRGIFSEYLYFLRAHRSWWLAPVLVAVLLLGVLVTVGGSKGALMIYALF